MSGETRGAKLKGLLLIAGFAGLSLALAASEVARLLDGRARRALETEVVEARREASAALAAVIAPQTLNAARGSVYLITVDGLPRGTAFVIDRANGVLVTAAHTANSLPLGAGNVRVQIVNRGLRSPIRVRSAKLHAGFGAFRELVEEYQPVRKGTSIYAPQVAPIRDLAFDAALLYVDPLDPETGENRLGANLPVASEDGLLALGAGAAVAVIGYPYDTLDDGFIQDAATSRIERGVIAAMIAPLDSARGEEDPEIANLIIHRMATAGGNSGSPIINAAGEVIGIHTHGIESLSSNADSAAQRADVIYDLLDPERERARLNDIFLPAWRRTLSFWARGEDVLGWSFYLERQAPNREPKPLVGDIDYDAPAPFEQTVKTLNFSLPTPELRIESETPGAGFTISEAGEYAADWVAVDRSRATVLFAFDYSLRSRLGFCRLTTYWRARGADRLQVQRARASFELYLPPAGEGLEDYQLVYRRDPGCDPASRAFIAGRIEWIPTETEGGGERAGEASPVSAFYHVARTSLLRTLVCGFGGESPDEACQPPETIEAQ